VLAFTFNEEPIPFKLTPPHGASDFAPAFVLVGGIAALSSLIFWRMPPDAGAELTDRRLAPAEPTEPAGPPGPPDQRAA